MYETGISGQFSSDKGQYVKFLAKRGDLCIYIFFLKRGEVDQILALLGKFRIEARFGIFIPCKHADLFYGGERQRLGRF